MLNLNNRIIQLTAFGILILFVAARPSGNSSYVGIKNEKYNTNVTITLLDVVSVYGVDKNYTFFIPKVDPQCECACVDNFAKCTDDQSIRDDQHECGQFSNATSTCTVYNYYGTDPKICPNKYQICCKVYFTKDLIFGDYVAVYLKYIKTEYKLKVGIKDSNGKINEYITFVRDGMDRIILSEDTIIQFYRLPRLNSINESWYYFSKKSMNLLSTSSINDRDSEYLDKIGWFKYGLYEKFSRIRLRDLEENFKVYFSNCENKHPHFTWKLNAIGYSTKNVILYFPNDTRVIADQNEISNITLDLIKNIVPIKESYRPDVKSWLRRVDASQDVENFMFYSKITLSNDVHMLNLQFFQGFGNFTLNVSFPYSIENISVSLTVENASTIHPFVYEKEMKMDDFQPPRICVQQEETVLCQSSSIISIPFVNVSTTDETFGNNSCNNDTSITMKNRSDMIWIIIVSLMVGFIIGWLSKSYCSHLWFNMWNKCRNQEEPENLGRNLTEAREKETALQEETSIPLVENLQRNVSEVIANICALENEKEDISAA